MDWSHTESISGWSEKTSNTHKKVWSTLRTSFKLRGAQSKRGTGNTWVSRGPHSTHPHCRSCKDSVFPWHWDNSSNQQYFMWHPAPNLVFDEKFGLARQNEEVVPGSVKIGSGTLSWLWLASYAEQCKPRSGGKRPPVFCQRLNEKHPQESSWNGKKSILKWSVIFS